MAFSVDDYGEFWFFTNVCWLCSPYMQSTRFSKLINGFLRDFFWVFTWYLPGDPLSSLLVCLAKEILNQGLHYLLA